MFRSILITMSVVGLFSTPVSADPTVFGKRSDLFVASKEKLNPKSQKHYSKFKNGKSYFGAFYFSPQAGQSYFVKNFHDLRAAKLAAKNGCRLLSGKANCILYAVSVPKGIDPNGKATKGLGHAAGSYFKGGFKKEQIAGKYGAFAISGGAEFGATWGWVSAKEARASAIAYCETDLAKQMAVFDIKTRNWFKSSGLAKCRVVHTTGPNH